MIPQLLLLHFLFSLLTIPPSFSYVSIPKPGCPDRCGDMPIQFPFGVGPNCSLGELFDIPCNTSNDGTQKPYLSISDVEVVEINPSQIRVRFQKVLNSACYNKSDFNSYPTEGSGIGFSFYNTPFVFSDDNWLTIIGCDDLLTTFSMDDDAFYNNNETFGGSCATICTNVNDKGGVGYCPDDDSAYPTGYGCCLIPIPKGN